MIVTGYLQARHFPTSCVARSHYNKFSHATGDAVSIAEQVPPAAFSSSATGVLVYGVGALSNPRTDVGIGVNGQLTWFDRGGKVLRTVKKPGVWRGLALSPDNTKLAYERNPLENGDVWVYEFAREIDSPLTSDPASDISPVWSADGSRIAFSSARKPPGVYQRASNGSGEDELLVPVDRDQTFIPSAGGWSSDGRFMLLTSNPGAASGPQFMGCRIERHQRRGSQDRAACEIRVP